MQRRFVTIAALSVTVVVLMGTPAGATIHPIVQSIACAAAQARENVSIADPPGQTPAGFEGVTEEFSFAPPFLTISFSSPLTFDQSDFRALIATGFVDQVVTNSDGDVTALVVDVTSFPKALSGKGGQHCANAA